MTAFIPFRFVPMLIHFCRWKQDAIDRMGFGLLNKILLAFDECFWQAATPKGKYIGYARHRGHHDKSLVGQ